MAARDHLTDRDRAFIAEQKMFFVATAPLAGDGLVNLSPKGLDGTFAVFDDHSVGYLDLTGSGVETIAHLRENGRVVLMFCAFDGRPNILRIHGTGDAIEPGHAEFAKLREAFTGFDVQSDTQEGAGVRSIIRVRVKRVADSCGFSVPYYDYTGQRDELTRWVQKKGAEGVTQYQESKNARSLDGLPGLSRLTP